MNLVKRSLVWMQRMWVLCEFTYPVQFNLSVVSESLQPHRLQHTRCPCPSPTPRACSNSCPLSWWCHPTISFSVVPFSSCLQSFPASGSFPISQLNGNPLQYSCLENPMDVGAWCRLLSMGSQRVGHNWATSLHFASHSQSIGASASASVLSMNIQDWFLLRLVLSPCSPRDSQESSPTPQFKSINSRMLRFHYGPTLTSIHDYWKNHSFD